jgi:hypothetical protein
MNARDRLELVGYVLYLLFAGVCFYVAIAALSVGLR